MIKSIQGESRDHLVYWGTALVGRKQMGIGNKSRHLNTKLAQLKTKIKGLPFVCDLDYKVIAMQQI